MRQFSVGEYDGDGHGLNSVAAAIRPDLRHQLVLEALSVLAADYEAANPAPHQERPAENMG